MDEKEAVTVNAHELAHEWCSGANCVSWEDWLNETTAEWSMLLYCLDRGKTDIFDAMIGEHMAKAPANKNRGRQPSRWCAYQGHGTVLRTVQSVRSGNNKVNNKNFHRT